LKLPGDDLVKLLPGGSSRFRCCEFSSSVGGKPYCFIALGQPVIGGSTVLSAGIAFNPDNVVGPEREVPAHFVSDPHRVVCDAPAGVEDKFGRDEYALAVRAFAHFKVAPGGIAKSVIGSPNQVSSIPASR
jgi:hypothetical protein